MRTCRVALSIVLVIAAATATAFARAADNVLKDVAYLGDERNEKVDIWLPPENFARPVPAVLLIHGGGWHGGSKSQPREKNIGSTLSAAGFAVFAIDYALNTGSETEVKKVIWPQNFHDCKSGLRFIRKEAQRYGIDPERIGVMGESAGGHLALLVGATQNSAEMNKGGLYTDQSNKVGCVIDFYGVCDVRTRRADRFAGATEEESKANAIAASPLTYFGKDTPPILIVHGDKDALVPVQMSRDCVALLKEKGITHEYVEIPGAPHSFHLQPKEMDLRPVVIAFLKKHLGEPRQKK
jgi:acetyl esterase/lipase